MRSESVFKRIPITNDCATEKEKMERERRSQEITTRALENPQAIVEKMADEWFQPYLVAGLKNSASCMVNLHDLLLSNPDQMAALSDFVTICLMFVYSKPQHRSRALTFLRSPEALEFQFLEVELVNLMTIMLIHPPSNIQEVKQSAQIIADLCMRSELCTAKLKTIMKPGHWREEDANQIALLSETAKVMQKHGKTSDYMDKFARGEIRAKEKPGHSRDPSPVERLYKIQERKEINRFFSDFLVPHRVFWYVMILLAIFVIIILVTV